MHLFTAFRGTTNENEIVLFPTSLCRYELDNSISNTEKTATLLINNNILFQYLNNICKNVHVSQVKLFLFYKGFRLCHLGPALVCIISLSFNNVPIISNKMASMSLCGNNIESGKEISSISCLRKDAMIDAN